MKRGNDLSGSHIDSSLDIRFSQVAANGHEQTDEGELAPSPGGLGVLVQW